MASNVALVEYDNDIVTFVLENEECVIIDTKEADWGPGVWRRVLTLLEEAGGEDRNHIMLAWKFGLIGEWKY